METRRLIFTGYLPEDKRKILGLTDDIPYPFLPIYLNFTLFSLNITNSFENSFDKYAFIVEDNYSSISDNIKDQSISNSMQVLNISESDNVRIFSSVIKDYIESQRIEKQDYFIFSPCNFNFIWTFNRDEIKKEAYFIDFKGFYEDAKKAIIIRTDKLLNVCRSRNILSINEFYSYMAGEIKDEIKPEVVYHFELNTLKEYLIAHLRIFQDIDLYNMIIHFTRLLPKVSETDISKEAEILNSFIGYGCTIKGKVQDSLIFNNVLILQDAEITGSIILPGTVIAKGVKIKDCIIGTYKNPMKDITVGPNTVMGYPIQSNLKNIKYSNDLPEGYTLIGNNTLLPGGVKIGKQCVIRGKINILELKKMKNLLDGGTFEQDVTL